MRCHADHSAASHLTNIVEPQETTFEYVLAVNVFPVGPPLTTDQQGEM